MLPEIRLKEVTKEDIERLINWLKDEDVSSSWFGRYTYGDPIHLGYHPEEMLKASTEEWNYVFNDSNKRIFSVYNASEEHSVRVRF